MKCTLIFTSFLIWLCPLESDGADLTLPICVEELPGKDVASKPIATTKVDSSRQCIVACLKYRIASTCVACVFQSGLCKLYDRSAKNSPGSFVDSIDGSIYYELMQNCPSQGANQKGFGKKSKTNVDGTLKGVNEMESSSVTEPSNETMSVNGTDSEPTTPTPTPPPTELPSYSSSLYSGPPLPTPAAYEASPPVFYRPVIPQAVPTLASVYGKPQPPPVSAQWTEWTEWSKCVCLYGTGTKSRTRTCQSSTPNCTGNSDQTEHCECPQAQWTDWSPWTPCPVTCGGGSQTRNRQCNIQNECTGSSSEQQPCANVPCQQWGQWNAWASCSATCGSGVQLRTRPCTGSEQYGGGGCIGSSNEQKTCVGPPCCSEWTPWQQCSVSCGNGNQLRTRDCGLSTYQSPQETKQQQPCYSGECPTWASWQAGPCSVTCGQGTITRTRQCRGGNDCKGTNTDTTTCNAGSCPEWGQWEPWQACSVSCGSGTRTRTRPCQGGSTCVGEGTESGPCDAGPCPQWSEWSTGPCSVTCGEGEQPMDRRCSRGNDCPGESHKAIKCNPGQCYEWCPWNSWGACTVTCGSGTRKRHRQCSIKGSCPQTYVPPSCPYCGQGPIQPPKPSSYYPQYRSRIRRYTQQAIEATGQCTGDSRMMESCNPGPCAQWGPWEAWSACSATCGPGVQTRTRTCTGGRCDGESEETKSCNQCQCPVWTEWGPWSPCSTSCDYGTRTRTRECPNQCNIGYYQDYSNSKSSQAYSGYGGTAVQTACPGDTGQMEPCASGGYWAPWNDWSACSTSCGIGYQTRNRECTCGTDCTGEAVENKHCDSTCPTLPPYSSYQAPPPPAYGGAYQPSYGGYSSYSGLNRRR